MIKKQYFIYEVLAFIIYFTNKIFLFSFSQRRRGREVFGETFAYETLQETILFNTEEKRGGKPLMQNSISHPGLFLKKKGGYHKDRKKLEEKETNLFH